MCNLYSQNTSADEVSRLFSGVEVRASVGNLAPGHVYPDQLAPIICQRDGKLKLARARWGMPTPSVYLKTARDPCVTNIRNTGSPHWRRWLGPEHRCLVPLDACFEPEADRQPVWFEAADDRPMFFAGLAQILLGHAHQRLGVDGDGVPFGALFALTCVAVRPAF